MTVSELIEHLRALPADMHVVAYNDDDHLSVLAQPPRIEKVFRYDEPDIVFYGEPDADERNQGASEPFPVVVIGVAS
jgi:hypothetical protein